MLRTTNIECSDVANSGATFLSIKSGAVTIMTMSFTFGITNFTYSDFNNNDIYIYNIHDITGVNNILGGSGVFSSARGSFTY